MSSTLNSVVYEATYTREKIQYDVVIKKLDDKGLCENELNVMLTMGNKESPHIIKILDACQSKGDYFLIIERAEHTLGSLHDKTEMDLNKKMIMFRQVLEGLTAMHKIHLTHRDLKLENIFVKKGQIKLGDFGNSKIKSKSEPCTKDQTSSLGYAAPEKLSFNIHEYNAKKADIHSLGIIFYVLWKGLRGKILSKFLAELH